MKRIEDVDFRRTYGDTPPSFERRVAYALGHVEEEKTVKKWPIKTVVLVCIMLLALGAVAYAAVTSLVAKQYGAFYGEDKGEVEWSRNSVSDDVVTINAIDGSLVDGRMIESLSGLLNK